MRPQRLSDVLNRALDHELSLCCAACLTIRDALDRRGVEAFLRQTLNVIASIYQKIYSGCLAGC